MEHYKFIFDLDSTITKEEILPFICKQFGNYNKMLELTEKAMSGQESFDMNFKNRIKMLKHISITEIHKIISNIQLHEFIKKFILENKERCIIITGNLDAIIYPILKILGMEKQCFSSKAFIDGNRILDVIEIVNKKDIVKNFKFPFVAVGDGENDLDMIKLAKIGIGFGGSRKLSKNILQNSNYIFYDDKELYYFLNSLL